MAANGDPILVMVQVLGQRKVEGIQVAGILQM